MVLDARHGAPVHVPPTPAGKQPKAIDLAPGVTAGGVTGGINQSGNMAGQKWEKQYELSGFVFAYMLCMMASFASAALMYMVDLERAWSATSAGKAGVPFTQGNVGDRSGLTGGETTDADVDGDEMRNDSRNESRARGANDGGDNAGEQGRLLPAES